MLTIISKNTENLIRKNTSNEPCSYKVLALQKWLETPLIITQNGKTD